MAISQNANADSANLQLSFAIWWAMEDREPDKEAPPEGTGTEGVSSNYSQEGATLAERGEKGSGEVQDPPGPVAGGPEEGWGGEPDPGGEGSSPKEEPRTSDYYQIKNKVPKRFDHPDWFVGYGASEAKNPFYQTSATTYGSKPPSVHTMPTKFHGRSQKFTERLGCFGMYRNHSLNTELDKSRVLKYANMEVDTNLS